MVRVDLYDPKYRMRPRLFATLIAERRSIDLYNAMLCTRGALVPLTDAAFSSPPTAHLACIRLLITLATIFRWGENPRRQPIIHTGDRPPWSRQSGNHSTANARHDLEKRISACNMRSQDDTPISIGISSGAAPVRGGGVPTCDGALRSQRS